MARFKMKDGKLVQLSPEEETLVEAEKARGIREEKERLAKEYQEKREMEYPSIGDQLDRIFKFIKANAAALKAMGLDIAEAEKFVRDIEIIKGKHPKPKGK